MKSFFEGLTDEQIYKWYLNFYKRATKNQFHPHPREHHVISGQRNDVFNVYSYGNIIKVVYIKNGRRLKNEDEKSEFKPEKSKNTLEKENERFSQSISRSKARVFELAMCNEFNYFCTFTQDKEKRDRFNLFDFRKDFTQFIRNQNRFRTEENKIKYLLIPEKHKDGAWHMHGLLSGLNDSDLRRFTLDEYIPERIKKQIRKGENVYDWCKYRKSFGYFTCTDIKSKDACAKYITKYISKDFQKNVREIGEHLFFASKGLKGREVILKNCYEECPIEDWDYENDYVKVKEIQILNLS